MQVIAILVCILMLAACHSDNASPERHGAHNKPSAGGKTKSDAPPPGNPDPPPAPAGGEGTYGESGATPGGSQGVTST